VTVLAADYANCPLSAALNTRNIREAVEIRQGF
jgi:hypothetical protein